MNTGGIAIRLINCAKLFGGRFYGPLAQANVVANMLFGAISGSGVAAAYAPASWHIPRHYHHLRCMMTAC